MAWSMRQARNETSNPFLGPSRPVESNSAVAFGSNALDDHVDHDVRKPACSFFDARNSKLRVKRLAWSPDWMSYINDPFHTLLNMRPSRFCIVFFGIYIFSYSLFAFLYLMCSDNCVEGIREFSHAFFFAVQTAATIGYGGDLTPNPECILLNLLVTLQTICSLLLDYSMLGLVYARFSCPARRANALRFSDELSLHTQDQKLMLSFRVANIRTKQILQPQAEMLLAMEADASVAGGLTEKVMKLQGLDVLITPEAKACLFLGLPATVTHVIDDSSPLAHLSLAAMAARNIQVMVLLEGIDVMTSQVLQARHAYCASHIAANGPFVQEPIRCLPSGQLAVSYECFQGHSRIPPAMQRTVSQFLHPVSSPSTPSSPGPEGLRAENISGGGVGDEPHVLFDMKEPEDTFAGLPSLLSIDIAAADKNTNNSSNPLLSPRYHDAAPFRVPPPRHSADSARRPLMRPSTDASRSGFTSHRSREFAHSLSQGGALHGPEFAAMSFKEITMKIEDASPRRSQHSARRAHEHFDSFGGGSVHDVQEETLLELCDAIAEDASASTSLKRYAERIRQRSP